MKISINEMCDCLGDRGVVRIFVLATTLFLTMTVVASAQSEANRYVTAIKVNERSSQKDLGVTWEDVWEFGSEASKNFEQQWEAYLEERGQYKNGERRSRPISSYGDLLVDRLPFSWDPVVHLPWDVLWPELKDQPEGSSSLATFWELFNIKVIVPRSETDFPADSLLKLEIFNDRGDVIQLTAPMRRGAENRYFLVDAADFRTVLMKEISNLNSLEPDGLGKPHMELVSMSGFSFKEERTSERDLYGTPVLYSVTIGDTRLFTGFQWRGRPDFIPTMKEIAPFLVD